MKTAWISATQRGRLRYILHLRNVLRQVLKDARLNTRVCNHNWTIITAEYDPKVNLSVDVYGVERVAPKSAAASAENAKHTKRAQSGDERRRFSSGYVLLLYQSISVLEVIPVTWKDYEVRVCTG